MAENTNDKIWAYLLHLSCNMWADRDAPEWGLDYVNPKPYLRMDTGLWNDLLGKMVDAGSPLFGLTHGR